MQKKIVWSVVSCLMVAALVLASCAPKAAEKEEVVTPKEEVVAPKEEVVTPKEEVVVTPKEEVVAPAVEVPRYGGVLNLGASSSPTAFDQCYTSTGGYDYLTKEDLLGGDWTKGPAGSGELSFLYPRMGLFGTTADSRIAESFEMPDPTTFVFKIRRGIHFQNKPPANGREVNADDVVYNLLRLWKDCPRSFHASFLPWSQNMISVEATDKWTVVVKTKGNEVGSNYELVADITKILPPEAIKQFGDMNAWQNQIGTGPFMLTDFIRDSAATFVKNPNYWMTDPIGPGKGNQLPYLDGVKVIIMPDLSTRMAALRTNKVDELSGVAWEDAARFKRDNPELKYVRYITNGATVFMRVDKPELPYYNKKVRQALSMAINRQEIAKSYYGGEAEVYAWPISPDPEWKRFQFPFEELPQSTQELFTYNPTKAKQLLAEAGYPNGFKTEIVALSTEVDLLSIVKAYWTDIGVDLKLDVKESAVKSSIGWLKTHKEMFFSTAQVDFYSYAMMPVRTGHYSNYSMVSDPRMDKAQAEAQNVYFDWDKRFRVASTDTTPYVLDQSWFVTLPAYYLYHFWQPWVKNYHGEAQVGYNDADWPRWVWLDQDLKEKMTGRR